MKAMFFTAALALILGTANAQKMSASQVPSAVTAKFATLYPNVKEVKWEKEGANYEAEFEANEVETSVNFDASGNFIESEIEMSKTDLPAAAHDYLAKNAPGARVKEVSKITDAAGKITWEAEAGELNYIFDESGNFIKTVNED